MKLSLLIALSSWALVACSTNKNPPPAEAVVQLPGGGSISQTGFAVVPAKVEMAGEQLTIDLPPKSVVSIEHSPSTGNKNISVQIPSRSVLKLNMQSAKVELPKSFPPPVPASPGSLARAASLKWFYWAGILLAVFGLFLAWRGHGKAAWISGLGGVGVCLLGNFVSSDAALWLSIGVGCISVTLFVAWFLVHRNPELEARIKAKILGTPVEPAK